MKPTYLNRFICFGLLSTAGVLAWAQAAVAENPAPVSWSAETTAIQRAVAAMHPDEKVRCPDFLATHFVTEANWHYSPYSRNYERSIKFIKTYRIGSYYYTNALTHHVDRELEAAGADVRQVVVLRAGFGTHAYRHRTALPRATFFELDLPGTLALKREMVRNRFKQVPGHVVFVPIDPETERLEPALKDAGYDEGRKTLFLWTGGTYHLSAGAVAATLDFVAHHSAPESRIVFDYIPAQVLADDASRRTRFRLALAGEPLTFGVPEEGVDAYLAARGFSLVSDMGWKELQQRYLIRSDGTPDGRPSPLYRVAVAEVSPRGAGPAQTGASSKEAPGNGAIEPLAGTWTGTDSLGGRLVFRFSPGGGMTAQRTGGRDPGPKEGSYQQTGKRIDGRMGDIAFTGSASENQITGSWRQGMMSADFTLTRTTQDP